MRSRWTLAVLVAITLVVGLSTAGRRSGTAHADHSHSGLISAGQINGNLAFGATFVGASADGSRVFFTTTEKLASGDTDGSQDVYERSGGVTTLVSAGQLAGSGNGAFAAFFDGGASADGTRVFFRSNEKLTSDDNTDSSADIYQRSGGVTTLISAGAINGDGAFNASFRPPGRSARTTSATESMARTHSVTIATADQREALTSNRSRQVWCRLSADA